MQFDYFPYVINPESLTIKSGHRSVVNFQIADSNIPVPPAFSDRAQLSGLRPTVVS